MLVEDFGQVRTQRLRNTRKSRPDPYAPSRLRFGDEIFIGERGDDALYG
jgi:hypothetical protein